MEAKSQQTQTDLLHENQDLAVISRAQPFELEVQPWEKKQSHHHPQLQQEAFEYNDSALERYTHPSYVCLIHDVHWLTSL